MTSKATDCPADCPAWCIDTEPGHTTHAAHVGDTSGPEFVLLIRSAGRTKVFLSTGTGDTRATAFLPLGECDGVAAALRLGATATTRELADLLDRAAQIAGGAR